MYLWQTVQLLLSRMPVAGAFIVHDIVSQAD